MPAASARRIDAHCEISESECSGHLVEARLEAICQKGCRQVRSDIASLEAGVQIPESHGLTTQERRRLVTDLKEIMSVYGDTCRID